MAAPHSSFAAAVSSTAPTQVPRLALGLRAAAAGGDRSSHHRSSSSSSRGDGSLVFRVPAPPHRHERERTTKRRAVGALGAAVASGASASATGESPSSATDESSAAARSSSATKKRWYAQRQDEKLALQKELAHLRALKELYEQAPPARALSVVARQHENAQLQRALMAQQLQFARAQSVLTGTLNPHRAPFARRIHLPTDWDDRARVLADLKPVALLDAERFVAERVRFLDPAVRVAQSERFDLPSGDVHFTGFNVLPLDVDVACSVRQVFEAVRLFYYNMEIMYTELSGEVMVREGDYDLTGDNGVKAQRFVRRTALGTQVESNSVLFSVLREGDGAGGGGVNSDGSVGETAVFVVDFVDRDERFPYSGGERVRQDTTATIAVKAFPRSVLGGGASGDPLRQHQHQSPHEQHGRADPAASPNVIVLSGAYYAHMHLSPVLGMPPDVVEGMSFASNFCFKSLLRTVVEYLNTSAQVQSEMSS